MTFVWDVWEDLAFPTFATKTNYFDIYYLDLLLLFGKIWLDKARLCVRIMPKSSI